MKNDIEFCLLPDQHTIVIDLITAIKHKSNKSNKTYTSTMASETYPSWLPRMPKDESVKLSDKIKKEITIEHDANKYNIEKTRRDIEIYRYSVKHQTMQFDLSKQNLDDSILQMERLMKTQTVEGIVNINEKITKRYQSEYVVQVWKNMMFEILESYYDKFPDVVKLTEMVGSIEPHPTQFGVARFFIQSLDIYDCSREICFDIDMEPSIQTLITIFGLIIDDIGKSPTLYHHVLGVIQELLDTLIELVSLS